MTTEPDTNPAFMLQTLTGLPILECKKALLQCNGDVDQANQLLASGSWRKAKLISWNQESINETVSFILNNFPQFSEAEVRETVLNCGGIEDRAVKMLLTGRV